MALTAKRIASAKLHQPGRYGDGNGLYLQVINENNRSWLLRYSRDGRERWMGLGALHTFTLKEARERARLQRLLLADGYDPLTVKRTAKAAAAKQVTFAEAAQRYWQDHIGTWKNPKHAGQFIGTLKTYAYPKIGNLPIAAIDIALVLAILEQPVAADRGNPAGPLWQARPETAKRIRARIETILHWAKARGYRAGDNPAAKDLIHHALPARDKLAKTEHHPALPFAEVSDFMQELATREGIAARALEFTIMTAARTGEVIGATWDEINLKEKIWTVPAERMKGGKKHEVPLSDRAVTILKGLPQEDGNPFVFIGPRHGGGMSDAAMASVLRRMGRRDITVHGFRSTFRDWAAEKTDYQNIVAEMALAHAIGGKVEASYRRGDLFSKRVGLMNDWARWCATKPASDNVTSIRSRQGHGEQV